MQAYFNRFVISMTKKQAESASHQGSCDDDVEFLCRNMKIDAQLRKILPADIAAELREYDAWDETELADHKQNLRRIVWIAAANIVEGALKCP